MARKNTSGPEVRRLSRVDQPAIATYHEELQRELEWRLYFLLGTPTEDIMVEVIKEATKACFCFDRPVFKGSPGSIPSIPSGTAPAALRKLPNAAFKTFSEMEGDIDG